VVASPLVETKLLAPQPRGDAVARPRLTELLDQGRERRLTLVSAPAGFGKTMLLAKGLTQPAGQRRPVAWVSLEEDDSQPARFWTYLVTAIHRALPDVGDGALTLLATGQPSLDGVVATLINELATTATELDLVLDDYHLVDGPDLQPSVAYLLEHLPPRVRLVISTRVDPALPLARLRARSPSRHSTCSPGRRWYGQDREPSAHRCDCLSRSDRRRARGSEQRDAMSWARLG